MDGYAIAIICLCATVVIQIFTNVNLRGRVVKLEEKVYDLQTREHYRIQRENNDV
jgi:hypothetical protein